MFNCRNQQPNKSIDAYMTTLRNLAKMCNFCDCLKDTLLRDRIVLGIPSQQTRKRLLQDRKLTLQKCIDLCRCTEAASVQLKSIANENSTIENVKSVDQRYRKPRRTLSTNERTVKSLKGTQSPANIAAPIIQR